MLRLKALGELARTWRRSLALVKGRLLSAVETVSTYIASTKIGVLIVGKCLCRMILRWVLAHVLLEATRL